MVASKIYIIRNIICIPILLLLIAIVISCESEDKKDTPPKTMISRFHNFPTTIEDTYGAVKPPTTLLQDLTDSVIEVAETIRNIPSKVITSVQ